MINGTVVTLVEGVGGDDRLDEQPTATTTMMIVNVARVRVRRERIGPSYERAGRSEGAGRAHRVEVPRDVGK